MLLVGDVKCANGTLNKVDSSKPATLTIYSGAFSKPAMDAGNLDTGLAKTFIHESFHMIDAESVMGPQNDLDHDQFNQDHHDPYNNGAWKMYER